MFFQTEPGSPFNTVKRRSATHLLIKTLLRLLAINFNLRPSLKKHLKSDQGWINFTIGIRTESRSIETGVRFQDGNVRVLDSIPNACDITLIFATDKAVRKLLGATPTEQIFMLMKSEFRSVGNASLMNLFFFYLSLLLHKKQKKMMQKERDIEKNHCLPHLLLQKKP